MSSMPQPQADEIVDGIHRISTWVPDAGKLLGRTIAGPRAAA